MPRDLERIVNDKFAPPIAKYIVENYHWFYGDFKVSHADFLHRCEFVAEQAMDDIEPDTV